MPGGSDGENADVLTLFNLQEQDSGVYVCTVQDPGSGASGRASSQVMVGESGPISGGGGSEQEPERPSDPLKVEVQPKEATLVQGREGEFVCNVQGGSPNRVVTWRKTGEQLDPVRHEVIGNRLLIKNVQANDRGYFECEAQSGDELVRDYTRVEVESREAPKIEIYPNEEKVELDIGGTVYAQCRVVAGIPAPTVEWRRVDRRPLSAKAVVSQEGSLLQITDAGHDEMGAYECVATNVEGEASQRLNIMARQSGEETAPHHPQEPQQPQEPHHPQEPYHPPQRPSEENENLPPDVNILTPVVQIPEGQTVNLQCQTSSPQPFRIDWFGPNGEYLGWFYILDILLFNNPWINR